MNTFPSPIRLLVIDDDARFPDYLRVLLRAGSTSFEIQVAATVRDGLRELGTGTYQVCLLDYRLGEEDGLEVLRRVPARRQRTPIVLLTADGSETLAFAALELGAADYLDKSELEPRRLERTLLRAIARHRADRALREREVRLARAEAFAHVMVAHIGLDGRWLSVPRRFCDLLGYSEDELLALPLADATFPDDLRSYLAKQQQLLSGSVRSVELEQRYVRKAGGHVWVYQNCSLVTGDDGTPIHFLAYIRDITDQKRAEEALRASEQRYSSMVRNAPYGIFEATGDGRFLAVNPALASMLGLESEQDALKIDPDQLYGGAEERWAVLDALVTNGRDGVDTRWVKRDGSALLVHVGAHPLPGNANVITGVVEDITQRTHLEEQLRQAHKMEAIGQLAGGVAHDFNNLLTAILGYTDLLKDRCSDIPDVCLDLDEVHNAGKSAAALTGQLLAFSRKQVLKPEVVNAATIIDGMQNMLSRILGEDISLVIRADDGVPSVDADPIQLQQVILNLAANARDAMPNGGELIIETTAADDTTAADVSLLAPGRYARITVRDNGCGMDSATQAHIFEPFFTTKSVGRGTGLGLATVYGIVKQSGGDITCDSAPNHGTTFAILLPASTKANADVDLATRRPTSAAGGTVLLVEDQASVRELTRRILETAGFSVLDSGEPREACEIARERHVDVLVADVVMPDMSGPELARSILAFKPSLPVLYMSGFAGHSALDEIGGAPFIRKPFTPVDLVNAVSDLLNDSSEMKRLEPAS